MKAEWSLDIDGFFLLSEISACVRFLPFLYPVESLGYWLNIIFLYVNPGSYFAAICRKVQTSNQTGKCKQATRQKSANKQPDLSQAICCVELCAPDLMSTSYRIPGVVHSILLIVCCCHTAHKYKRYLMDSLVLLVPLPLAANVCITVLV